MARRWFVPFVWLLAIVARAQTNSVSAQDPTPAAPPLPQWEAGLFAVGAYLPHYRGSDESRAYVLPLPYIIYRGRIVQVDREGVRGFFYKGRYLETDVSLSGNPPVYGGNEARSGMPDLDPLVEFGPAARGFIYRGRRLTALYIEAAVRGVTAVDINDAALRWEGARMVINLVAPSYVPGPDSKWSAGGQIGLEFTDRRYNAYFYDVPKEQVVTGRDYYRSSAGYGGGNVSMYVTRELRPGLSVSTYIRWDNISGAVYEDSPLVRTRNNVVLGAALVWKLIESDKRADSR